MLKSSLTFSADVLALNPSLAGKEKTARLHTGGVGESVFGEPQFRSKFERRAWHGWALKQGARLVLYEPMTLNLTGARYKPDFVLLFDDDRHCWIIEVKASWKSHASARSSKHSLKQAAIEFSWLGEFFVLTVQQGSWTLVEVK